LLLLTETIPLVGTVSVIPIIKVIGILEVDN
jgi:hypothetical protein